MWCTKSMLTVSFDKHSMRFCSSFLQMVTENQCYPQIVISRHKIRHVQRYYKLCCYMKLVLFWDFWHQWRSLMITTLSARAIYRQIPVSYLQTWYIYACILRFCLNKKKHLHICKRCKSKKSGSVVLTDSTVLLLIILFTTTPGVPIIKKKKERTGQKSSHPLEARHVPIEL